MCRRGRLRNSHVCHRKAKGAGSLNDKTGRRVRVAKVNIPLAVFSLIPVLGFKLYLHSFPFSAPETHQ